MIVNTGGRTDTVQYYTDWLLRRFSEGYVLVRNPLFQNKVSRYELTPDKVDCVVFCSKNYRPILPRLHEITDKFNTYFYYTITAYGKEIEPGVPSVQESMRTLIELSEQIGKERVAWRYDPVLLTQKYTVETHLKTFEEMTNVLAPYIDRCIFSFVEMYKKLETNMPEMIPLSEQEKETLAEGFGAIARKYGIHLQTCGTNGDYTRYGIHKSGCMTLDILGHANGIKFKSLKHKGIREGCHCIESRDIGAYDTCMNGCKYCYANKNPHLAFDNYKRHSPESPLLLGQLKSTDTVTQSTQRSFLAREIPPVIREIEVKSILSKSGLPVSDYSVNPYVGCTHACKYCYASFMKRFTNHSEPWGGFLDVKHWKPIKNPQKYAGKELFIGSVTDPYHPQEAVYERTRELLKELQGRGVKLSIATKSDLILRDLDLIKTFPDARVSWSINTLDETFKDAMDKAVSIKRRLAAMREFHNAGVRTTCFISPIFPAITDVKAIIERVREDCNLIWLENLNLRGGCKVDIMNCIAEKYPHLLSLYQAIYNRNDRSYWKMLDAELKTYASETGLDYVTNDDSISRSFHEPPVIVNYFYHSQIKKSAGKGGEKNA